MTPSRVRHAVARESRGRATWAVPLLLFAAILLVAGLTFNLAYLDTGGDQLPPTPGSTPASPGSGGILSSPLAQALVFGLLVAGGIIGLALYVTRRRKGLPVKKSIRPTTWMDVVAMIIAFALMGSLLLLWPRIVSSVEPQHLPASANPNATANATLVPTVSGIPLGVFLAASVFVSLIAIALFFRVGSNLARRPPETPRRVPRRAAVRAVQAAIDEIQLGGDVREAILACYARFCALLGAKGLAAQEALTPREIEALAVDRLAVSGESSDALTSLFEEARYSEHALGDADRERAVRSLERIRADLEA